MGLPERRHTTNDVSTTNMNYQGAVAVIIVVCLTVDVRADEAQCAATIGTCTISNGLALIASDCAGKKPFFDCLKSGGCTTAMTSYKTSSTGAGYDGCGAGSIVMGFSLPILMFTLAKFFSQ